MTLGYSRTNTVKILRTKHNVTAAVGVTGVYLKSWLKSVPDDAVVDEWETNDDGSLTITFHDEAAEKETT